MKLRRDFYLAKVMPMVTLLCCFFIVLSSSRHLQETLSNQAQQQSKIQDKKPVLQIQSTLDKILKNFYKVAIPIDPNQISSISNMTDSSKDVSNKNSSSNALLDSRDVLTLNDHSIWQDKTKLDPQNSPVTQNKTANSVVQNSTTLIINNTPNKSSNTSTNSSNLSVIQQIIQVIEQEIIQTQKQLTLKIDNKTINTPPHFANGTQPYNKSKIQQFHSEKTQDQNKNKNQNQNQKHHKDQNWQSRPPIFIQDKNKNKTKQIQQNMQQHNNNQTHLYNDISKEPISSLYSQNKSVDNLSMLISNFNKKVVADVPQNAAINKTNDQSRQIIVAPLSNTSKITVQNSSQLRVQTSSEKNQTPVTILPTASKIQNQNTQKSTQSSNANQQNKINTPQTVQDQIPLIVFIVFSVVTGFSLIVLVMCIRKKFKTYSESSSQRQHHDFSNQKSDNDNKGVEIPPSSEQNRF